MLSWLVSVSRTRPNCFIWGRRTPATHSTRVSAPFCHCPSAPKWIGEVIRETTLSPELGSPFFQKLGCSARGETRSFPPPTRVACALFRKRCQAAPLFHFLSLERDKGRLLKSPTSGKAGGLKDVNRSKRLANLAPPEGGATIGTWSVGRGGDPPPPASGYIHGCWLHLGPRSRRSSPAPRSAAP